jgi:hypothetical protein
MGTVDHQQIVIAKLMEKGYSREQAEGFISALQDTDLAREVRELTGVVIGITAADIAGDLFL